MSRPDFGADVDAFRHQLREWLTHNLPPKLPPVYDDGALAVHREWERRLASVTKLFWSQMQARIFETALEVMGPDSELDDDVEVSGTSIDMQHRYWHARGAQIFAGMSEVQRNLLAERMLGLPKGPSARTQEAAR